MKIIDTYTGIIRITSYTPALEQLAVRAKTAGQYSREDNSQDIEREVARRQGKGSSLDVLC